MYKGRGETCQYFPFPFQITCFLLSSFQIESFIDQTLPTMVVGKNAESGNTKNNKVVRFTSLLYVVAIDTAQDDY